MSEFTGTGEFRFLKGEELKENGFDVGIQTTARLGFDIGKKGGERLWIEKGEISNLASSPRLLWWIVSPFEHWIALPSLLHDALYRRQEHSKIICDCLFYEAMITMLIASKQVRKKWKARIAFDAVWYLANPAWENCQQKKLMDNKDFDLPYPILAKR